ncbi:hypothetical protein [Streptococcus ferus]|uniref:hypothetical protein n=1 Tax=Streptococcus ferus TaxID=1345 RepID=UPI0035A0F8E8
MGGIQGYSRNWYRKWLEVSSAVLLEGVAEYQLTTAACLELPQKERGSQDHFRDRCYQYSKNSACY